MGFFGGKKKFDPEKSHETFYRENVPEKPLQTHHDKLTSINLEEPVRVASPHRINLEEPVRVASPHRINLEEPISSGSASTTGLICSPSVHP